MLRCSWAGEAASTMREEMMRCCGGEGEGLIEEKW
jgi:hypothetical protein